MSSDTNDPYMTVTPGIHHYSDYYKIIVPGNYINNIISVIIPIDYFDKIKTWFASKQIYHSFLEFTEIIRKNAPNKKIL